MNVLLLALSLPAFAQEECPDVALSLQDAEGEVVSFFLADASASLKTAVDSLGCSGPASPEIVSRLFITEGMVRMLSEDPEGADMAFAAAKDGAKDYWNNDFGDEAKATFEAAERPSGAWGQISFANLGKNETVWVDGKAHKKTPIQLTPGPHLIQVGSSDTARFAKVVDVVSAAAATIALPAIVVASEDDGVQYEQLTIKPKRKRRMISALAVGGAGLVVYGASIGTRQIYNNDGNTDAMFFATNGLYGTSVILGVTAGALAIAALATPPVQGDASVPLWTLPPPHAPR